MELFPDYKNGADIFYQNNLLGQRPIIKAHCIFMDDDVLALMKNPNCMSVHCPGATANISIATRSGGRYFKNVGAFDEGYCFNALVIDDSNMCGEGLTPVERLERFCYAGDDRNIRM